MDKGKYIGHLSQLWRIEEHRLIGGKGDGLRLLEVNNGIGLQMTLTIDKCLDISRLDFRGMNMGYFSPCGYAHPSYFEYGEKKFLKTFTAGFLTTCGFDNVGVPCTDNGVEYALHGTISNTPAEFYCYKIKEDEIIIEAEMSDEVIFGRKLRLNRKIFVSLTKNSFRIEDEIKNTGEADEPVEVLYHLNMGYPLLDEDSVVKIHSSKVEPRDSHAAEDTANWMNMETPTLGYEERVYYHSGNEKGVASIYQPKLHTELTISYDSEGLDCFTEWKMMGYRDYVLGLECGNCFPDGRVVTREKGLLKILKPENSFVYVINISFEDR